MARKIAYGTNSAQGFQHRENSLIISSSL